MSDRVQRHGIPSHPSSGVSRTLNAFITGGEVGIGISIDGSEISELIVRLAPEDLAEALNELDGFTVRYKRPVHVPSGIGAVVGPRDGSRAYVRMGESFWMLFGDTRTYTNSMIEGFLRNGAQVLSEGVEVDDA